MENSTIKRRDFLKKVGVGTTAFGIGMAAPNAIAKTANENIVESDLEYGEFWVEKLGDKEQAYKIDNERYKQPSEKMTIFSRNKWDPDRQDRPGKGKGKGKVTNENRLDKAFRAGGFSVMRLREFAGYNWDSPKRVVMNRKRNPVETWDPGTVDMSWEDMSIATKHAALFYGASLAGVAKVDKRWLYSDHFSSKKDHIERTIPVISEGDRFEKTEDSWYIPDAMDKVIVLAFEEDYEAISNSPGDLAEAAVGNGYSRMKFTSFCLSEFIRSLGYRALPSGNGVGLNIPMAIDAGLGEIGRNGLLITPKYGPRVRLAKVFTDMPLSPDSPIRFGVTEFCESCKICATECPSGSISKEPRTWEGTSKSNNPGAYKWYVHVDSCFDYNNFTCANCKRTCPFNKPNNSWLHKLIRQGIKTKIEPANKIMVKMDEVSGYGTHTDEHEFWSSNGDNKITTRKFY